MMHEAADCPCGSGALLEMSASFRRRRPGEQRVLREARARDPNAEDHGLGCQELDLGLGDIEFHLAGRVDLPPLRSMFLRRSPRTA